MYSPTPSLRNPPILAKINSSFFFIYEGMTLQSGMPFNKRIASVLSFISKQYFSGIFFLIKKCIQYSQQSQMELLTHKGIYIFSLIIKFYYILIAYVRLYNKSKTYLIFFSFSYTRNHVFLRFLLKKNIFHISEMKMSLRTDTLQVKFLFPPLITFNLLCTKFTE